MNLLASPPLSRFQGSDGLYLCYKSFVKKCLGSSSNSGQPRFQYAGVLSFCSINTFQKFRGILYTYLYVLFVCVSNKISNKYLLFDFYKNLRFRFQILHLIVVVNRNEQNLGIKVLWSGRSYLNNVFRK